MTQLEGETAIVGLILLGGAHHIGPLITRFRPSTAAKRTRKQPEPPKDTEPADVPDVSIVPGMDANGDKPVRAA